MTRDITEQTHQIRGVARELFMQYGLKSVSMDDVAARLGISKKTLYRHFTDKEALVAAVVREIVDQNRETCELDFGESKDAVHEMMLALLRIMDLLGTMNPSVLFDLSKYYPSAHRIYLQHRKDFLFHKIRSNLLRGMKEGLYRDDLAVDILAFYRLESIMLPFHPELQSLARVPMSEIATTVFTLFLRGIVTRKGERLIDQYLPLTNNRK